MPGDKTITPRGKWPQETAKFRVVLLVLLASAGIVLARGWILSGLARLLIREDRSSRTDFPDGIWIRGSLVAEGYGCYDLAAQLYHERPARQVLLVRREADRLVRNGIVPPLEEVTRRELAARGVPSAAFQRIGPPARNGREETQRLGEWLKKRPGMEVMLLCDRFASATRRQFLDEELPAQTAVRIKITAIPDPRFDESNWWHSRDGVRSTMFAILARLYARFRGPAAETIEPWDPDEYERELRRAATAGEGP
jgi:hypothetical protein